MPASTAVTPYFAILPLSAVASNAFTRASASFISPSRGDDIAEEIPYPVYLAGERAVHEPICGIESRRALGVDHVRDSFCVGKGEPARKIRPLGELPSFGKSRTRSQRGVERAFHYPHSAVEIKFHGVLSRIRRGGGEKDGVALVAEIAGIEGAEAHETRRPGKGTRVRTNENGIGDCERVLTGHAHDADTTCPYGR